MAAADGKNRRELTHQQAAAQSERGAGNKGLIGCNGAHG